MWIFFPNAMLSIVAHREKPDCLLVRARFKGDIERVFAGARVQRTPRADYMYRASVKRLAVADALGARALLMTYTNVKGAIPADQNRRRRAMHDVWQVMFDAQYQPEDKPMEAPKPAAVELRSGEFFSHTTKRKEPRTVFVALVQPDQVGGETMVTLQYIETERWFTMPLAKAQKWLRNAELMP